MIAITAVPVARGASAPSLVRVPDAKIIEPPIRSRVARATCSPVRAGLRKWVVIETVPNDLLAGSWLNAASAMA